MIFSKHTFLDALLFLEPLAQELTVGLDVLIGGNGQRLWSVHTCMVSVLIGHLFLEAFGVKAIHAEIGKARSGVVSGRSSGSGAHTKGQRWTPILRGLCQSSGRVALWVM
jgi:hypothetical protein